jgi:hypothetical protein
VSDSPAFGITPTSNPSDYYDSTGTSPDDNQSCADYDGVGFSYSAGALAGPSVGFTPGATVHADGLTFTWTSGNPCSPDNILAAGQTMLVGGPPGANTLGLLESSTDGGTQGTITINYTDGSSSTATISSSDWAQGPSSSETAAATLPYRNSVSGSSQQLTVYVYATTVPVDPNNTVKSITFPDGSNTTSAGATSTASGRSLSGRPRSSDGSDDSRAGNFPALEFRVVRRRSGRGPPDGRGDDGRSDIRGALATEVLKDQHAHERHVDTPDGGQLVDPDDRCGDHADKAE